MKAAGVGVACVGAIDVRAAAKTLDVSLEPAVRFTADVVDAVTGEPVEGFVLWSWREHGVRGISDAAGRIVIDEMLPGGFEFNAGGGKPRMWQGREIYGHGPFGRWWSPAAVKEWERRDLQAGVFQRNLDDLSFDLAPEMDPVRIEVERGVVFTGRVTDPNGTPVVGATVSPAKTGSGNSLTGDTRYSVRTKADGRYRVVMPAGNAFAYNLVAHDGKYRQWRGWANGVSGPIRSKPGDEIEVDLTLTRPCRIEGRVVRPDGSPAADVEVKSQAADFAGNRYYDPTTKTDAEGRFVLEHVRPGKHYVQAEPFWLKLSEAPLASTFLVSVGPDDPARGVTLTAER